MKNFFSLSCYFLVIAWAGASKIGCDSHATIYRRYQREGFHLTVDSVVELVVDVGKNWDNCSLALKENIPDSFYVDPDQLAELKRSGLIQACVTQKIDIEAPQFLSEPHTVYIYKKFKRSQNLIHSHVKFPLHIRYHSPTDTIPFVYTELNPPVLLIHCPHVNCVKLLKNKAPCPSCTGNLCTYTRFPYKTNGNDITFAVPVGNVVHFWLVSTFTYSITYGGCFYLTLTIILNTNK